MALRLPSICLFVFFLFNVSIAQKVGITYTNRIDKIWDANHNDWITDSLRKTLFVGLTNRNVFSKVIDENGEILYHVYDSTKINLEVTRSFESQTKPGQPTLPFNMTSTKGVQLVSAKLIGKTIILAFWPTVEAPLMDTLQFISYNKILNELETKVNLISILITGSDLLSTTDFANRLKYRYSIVTKNSQNFAERFQIMQVPTFLAISKTGHIIGYFNKIENLKEVLIKN